MQIPVVAACWFSLRCGATAHANSPHVHAVRTRPKRALLPLTGALVLDNIPMPICQFVNVIKDLKSQGNLSDDITDDESSLQELFDSIDTDKSGTIEMDEYFIWTLDVATKQGCGLELIFKKYDTSNDGVLDSSEFALAVEDLGFTATFAHELFVDLDEDNSGAVTVDEVRQACPVSWLAQIPSPLFSCGACSAAHIWHS